MRRVQQGRKKPETILQEAIINYLKVRDWGVKNMHGNKYQQGIPDLYAYHAYS